MCKVSSTMSVESTCVEMTETETVTNNVTPILIQSEPVITCPDQYMEAQKIDM
jgi:hypothetical protein